MTPLKSLSIILMCSILVGACASIEDDDDNSVTVRSTAKFTRGQDDSPVLLHQVAHVCILPDKFEELAKDFGETIIASWEIQPHGPSEPSGTGFLTANPKTGSTTVAYATHLINTATGSEHGRVCIAFVGMKFSEENKGKQSEKISTRNLLESDL
jgi:hypothetical protein